MSDFYIKSALWLWLNHQKTHIQHRKSWTTSSLALHAFLLGEASEKQLQLDAMYYSAAIGHLDVDWKAVLFPLQESRMAMTDQCKELVYLPIHEIAIFYGIHVTVVGAFTILTWFSYWGWVEKKAVLFPILRFKGIFITNMVGDPHTPKDFGMFVWLFVRDANFSGCVFLPWEVMVKVSSRNSPIHGIFV